MTNPHARRSERARRAKFEKTTTWAIWTLLLVGGTAAGVFSLVIGIIDAILVIVGASTGQNVDGWSKLVWYFIAGALLVALPWPILAVVVVGLRQQRRVWPWPAVALVVAVEISLGLGHMYGHF
ncbi:hypothetical protein [Segniliparus rugosus]|uniref:Uncharacterized protein n=1 Tax=Segniliparus rugosus (strain ATCC BAA-974 / DSM 45345 / CCUG 50838 / CIP 108380 / JCM 13579 / CDC 945) TaxID=679197 RepID=E5XQL1_SEGRC|nr:hypothetical protein [Segniliparus rugosus]EFV13361.2 hypothetical protein HMPREF9336_01783 [Segniliparus rugosus ATCC BAA-974]